MINLDQLQAFVAAVDEGSFSAAARRLGKAQSAVSTAVINLEIDTQVELFDRSGRTPVLTEPGRSLLSYARSVLRSAGEFEAQASSLSEGIETRLGIAVEQGIFVHSLLGIFDELGQQFPRLEVELFDSGPNEVAELLKAGLADVGIMIEQETYPQGFHYKGIGHSQLIPVCGQGHPLADTASVSYGDLRKHRQLVGPNPKRNSDGSFSSGKSPSVWVCENPYLILELVLAGLGWAELPIAVVREKLAGDEVVRLNYQFQQSSVLQGVDLVWTERHSLGTSGLWLMSRLQALPADLWSD